MSQRIVNDPSLHGWTEESGKWVWDGTDSGAGIIISETEPDAVDGTQWLNALTGEVFIYDDGKWLEFPGGKDGAAGADGNIADGTADSTVATWNGAAGQWAPNNNVTIDAGGSATFSGDLRTSERYIISGAGLLGPIVVNGTSLGIDILSNGSRGITLSTANTTRLTIDAVGNATFTGDRLYLGSDGSGYGWMAAEGIRDPAVPSTDVDSLTIGYQLSADKSKVEKVFSNPDFYGNKQIYMSGKLVATVTSVRGDIIKTLTTLRQATMDETQDIRESLRSAIDELVEGFEQQISTMEESE